MLAVVRLLNEIPIRCSPRQVLLGKPHRQACQRWQPVEQVFLV